MPQPPPLSDEDVDAYAAGEASADVVERVVARAATDPAFATRVAARVQATRRLEARLRAEPLGPMPAALVASILDRVRGEARASFERDAAVGLRMPRWARTLAASLLVAVGAWATVAGIEPVAAAAGTVAAANTTVTGPGTGAPRSLAAATLTREALARVPTVDARRAATTLSDRADDVPGGSTTLVLAGAGLLAAALVAARRLRLAPGVVR